jgi:hypothetical protein
VRTSDDKNEVDCSDPQVLLQVQKVLLQAGVLLPPPPHVPVRMEGAQVLRREEGGLERGAGKAPLFRWRKTASPRRWREKSRRASAWRGPDWEALHILSFPLCLTCKTNMLITPGKRGVLKNVIPRLSQFSASASPSRERLETTPYYNNSCFRTATTNVPVCASTLSGAAGAVVRPRPLCCHAFVRAQSSLQTIACVSLIGACGGTVLRRRQPEGTQAPEARRVSRATQAECASPTGHVAS